jgi:hypothetical protein
VLILSDMSEIQQNIGGTGSVRGRIRSLIAQGPIKVPAQATAGADTRRPDTDRVTPASRRG